jgi:hypothetical protein
MTSAEFGAELKKLSRPELELMLSFLHGAAPGFTGDALAMAERLRRLTEEQKTARCPA